MPHLQVIIGEVQIVLCQKDKWIYIPTKGAYVPHKFMLVTLGKYKPDHRLS
jgi:hypothetical protein